MKKVLFVFVGLISLITNSSAQKTERADLIKEWVFLGYEVSEAEGIWTLRYVGYSPCYRKEAGSVIAMKLVDALQKALLELERNPAIGSPALGLALGIDGLRSWRIDGFPLSFWYFERQQHIDIARLVGHRQDAELIEL